MEIPYRAFEQKAERYAYILAQLERILEETDDRVAGLANASALLWLLMPGLNWAGFYLMKEGGLSLGPFQGKPAVPWIPVGKGVCGTAALEKMPQVVEDVHACCNHIACDLNSASEIVVPLLGHGGEVLGVLDIDSPSPAHFEREDLTGLTQFSERLMDWYQK
ncbi:MAG: GAF domain-containing protein [Clostridia bacterium]|nr:GAF domain-containing protein [Clostridia bacterium]